MASRPNPPEFRNSADMHPSDIVQTQCKLSVMVADHGVPDLLALLAEEIRTMNDYGMQDVRRVLDTRADAIRSLAAVIR